MIHVGLIIVTNHPHKGKVIIARLEKESHSLEKSKTCSHVCTTTLNVKFKSEQERDALLENELDLAFGVKEVLTHKEPVMLKQGSKPGKTFLHLGIFIPWEMIADKIAKDGSCMIPLSHVEVTQLRSMYIDPSSVNEESGTPTYTAYGYVKNVFLRALKNESIGS